MKRIKLLQLVGKESRRGLFLKGIREKDQTTEMQEGQITSMIEYLKEDQTREDKIEGQSLNPQGSNVLVSRDMVT